MDQRQLGSHDSSDFHYTATETSDYIYISVYLNTRFDTGKRAKEPQQSSKQKIEEFDSLKVLSMYILTKMCHNVYGLCDV